MIGNKPFKLIDCHLPSEDTQNPSLSVNGDDICIVINDWTWHEVKALRKIGLSEIYPDMDLDNDFYDRYGLTLYKRDHDGVLKFTVRLTFDGPFGLPESEFIKPLKERGLRFIELGRLVITTKNIDDLKLLYRSCYHVALATGHNAIVMAMKPKDIAFHKRLMGVNVVCDDMKIDYGGPYSLACVIWELENTNERFYRWAQVCR